ncbi:MAG TPA: response regulator transcription factor [Lachnospiraceae bacterium]|nr:response regulator transcription factor [Lachnospiraceae bacterium]
MDKIYIMEDDRSIREELCTLLLSNGYQPVSEPPCDLALLDINMPEESGFEICRKLRQSSDVPIIFLTAREAPEDELLGFAVGADDYIRKPYNSAVLLARINRHLKRNSKAILHAKDIFLNLSNLTVSAGERSVELTKNEARILACLIKKELCSREEIIEDLWNNSLYIDENTLYVNINRLRDKMRSIGMEHLITTVRGIGYRL